MQLHKSAIRVSAQPLLSRRKRTPLRHALAVLRVKRGQTLKTYWSLKKLMRMTATDHLLPLRRVRSFHVATHIRVLDASEIASLEGADEGEEATVFEVEDEVLHHVLIRAVLEVGAEWTSALAVGAKKRGKLIA